MRKKNIVEEKSFDFALQVIEACKNLVSEKKEFVVSKQMLRSGTAIGALVREAQHAESKKDFIHKLAIAQKEAYETEYWLQLLNKSDYLDALEFEKLLSNLEEIQKLLASIIITSKKKS